MDFDTCLSLSHDNKLSQNRIIIYTILLFIIYSLRLNA